jgi:hypothetical protein
MDLKSKVAFGGGFGGWRFYGPRFQHDAFCSQKKMTQHKT